MKQSEIECTEANNNLKDNNFSMKWSDANENESKHTEINIKVLTISLH